MKIRNIMLGAIVICTTAAAMTAETYKEAWTKGIEEYKAKKYKEALVTLGKAAKLAKTPSEKYNSMYYLGFSLRFLQKYNEAAKVYENLLKVDKLSAGQRNNAFNLYLHNIYWGRKYDTVLAIAKKTLADDKATKSMKNTCLYLSCLSSNNLKKYADLGNFGKKLVELNPKGVWHSRGLIYQAQALARQKKPEAALKMLNKDVIAKMHPYRQYEAYNERGNIKYGIKKYQEAIIEFTAIYEMPKGPPNHKEVAIIRIIEALNASGKPEAAAVWIEKIDTIKSKYWKTRGLLRVAQNLQRQGKLEAAKKKWEECKKGGPWWTKLADKQIAVIDKKLKK